MPVARSEGVVGLGVDEKAVEVGDGVIVGEEGVPPKGRVGRMSNGRYISSENGFILRSTFSNPLQPASNLRTESTSLILPPTTLSFLSDSRPRSG